MMPNDVPPEKDRMEESKDTPRAVLEQKALGPEKKEMVWMGGMIECFSSVFTLFSREDLSLNKGKRKYNSVFQYN